MLDVYYDAQKRKFCINYWFHIMKVEIIEIPESFRLYILVQLDQFTNANLLLFHVRE